MPEPLQGDPGSDSEDEEDEEDEEEDEEEEEEEGRGERRNEEVSAAAPSSMFKKRGFDSRGNMTASHQTVEFEWKRFPLFFTLQLCYILSSNHTSIYL